MRDAIPNYLKSVPIPYGFSDLTKMSLGQFAHLLLFVGASGAAGYAISQVGNIRMSGKCEDCMFVIQKVAQCGRCNKSVKLDQPKVVDQFTTADVGDQAVY